VLRLPRVVLVFLSAVAVSCAAGPEQLTAGGRERVYIDADRIEYAEKTGEVSASGAVVVEYRGNGQVRLHADRIHGNLKDGEITASGDVLVEHGESRYRAKGVVYRVRSGDFIMDDVRVAGALEQEDGRRLVIYSVAKQIKREADVMYILRGEVTTCDRPKPHYALICDEFIVIPGRQLIMKGVSARLYGIKFPKVPKITHSLGDVGPRRSWFPMPGYSDRDGFYVSYNRALGDVGKHFKTEAQVRLTNFRGIRGTVRADYLGGGWGSYLKVMREETVRYDVKRKLFLSALPEWGVTASGEVPWWSELSYEGAVRTGEYKERPWNTKAVRHQLEVGVGYRDGDRARGVGRWGGLGVQESFYGTGDQYGDIALDLGAGMSFSRRLSGSLTYYHHVEHGATPFEFDDVDLPRELRGKLDAWVTDNWAVGCLARYDLRQSSVRDYTLSLTRRAHCLSWTVQYRNVGSEIGLRVDVNGLTNNLRMEGSPEAWLERTDSGSGASDGSTQAP